MKKYRKDDYNGVNNKKEKKIKKYEPSINTIKEFNEKTEKYEYKQVIINHKLEWENQVELINSGLIEEKTIKEKL